MYQILIAEDESRIAAFLEKGLRRQGYYTQVAQNGREALQITQTQGVDLLLLDLGLPDQDGWEVLAKIRAARGATPAVIVVTARDDDRDAIKRLELQVADYITKPFRFNDLLERIQHQLAERSIGQPAQTPNCR
ncbi:MAG: response regulator [Elainella sp. Prado103]|jgi:DNA-binding response OmpR family regulator|nr:response regulator [Elainella sp. Prado103]